MKKIIERIVESPGAPNENDLWLNGTTLKKFENGEWKTIAGGGSSGGGSTPSGGGCDCPEIVPNGAASFDDIDKNLLSLKIGDTTYLIPGGVWIVPCTLYHGDHAVIVPNGISFVMVVDAFIRGYNVMFVEERQDGEQNYYKALSFFPESTDAPSYFEIPVDGMSYYWSDPNWQDGGGGEGPIVS